MVEESSTSHKFARNSLFNLAGFLITLPILILLTPYMLEVLGKAKFGIWALVAAVTSYTQLSDLGMTTALVKFVAEHWVERDVERISGIVSTAFFSFAVVGGLVAGSILLLRHSIVVNLLKVPPELQTEALFVLTGIVAIFYFNLVFGVYNSILLGIQRMDVTNGIMIVSNVLRAVGMYFFLAYGFGLKGLIVNSAIFSFLTVGANVFFTSRLTAGLKINPFWFSFSELKGIVKYSANIFAARLTGLSQDPINKIIIASHLTLPFVAFYEIGLKVSLMVQQVFQVGLSPLLPASSELASSHNKKELEKIYFTLFRMLYLFAVPVFLLVIVLAEPLVQVWLGDGYKWAARALQFLSIGTLFSLLVTPQYIILQGVGKPQINTIAHAIATGINIVLAIVLVRYIGIYGVFVGVVFSLFISSLFIDSSFRKIANIDLKMYLCQVSPVGIFSCIVLCGILIYCLRFINVWNLGKLTGLAGGFSLFYLAILAFGKVLDEKDRKLIREVFKLLNFSKQT